MLNCVYFIFTTKEVTSNVFMMRCVVVIAKGEINL